MNVKVNAVYTTANSHTDGGPSEEVLCLGGGFAVYLSPDNSQEWFRSTEEALARCVGTPILNPYLLKEWEGGFPVPDHLQKEVFRAIRLKHGWNFRTISRLLGVRGISQVADWEAGKRPIPEYISRLLSCLDQCAECRIRLKK
jgi:hypothetical protein